MSLETRRELRQRLFGGGSFSTVGVDRGRQILAELRPPGGMQVAFIEDRVLPVDPEVRVRIYHPRPDEELPVLVWAHGGGWCLGDLDTTDGQCRALAAGADHVVVSVDYRLAPEHPYPAALDDVTAVAQWTLANARSIGGDPRRVRLGGESAGASLALGAAARGGAPAPAGLVLVVPVVDLDPGRPSMARDPDPDLPVADVVWFAEQYLSDRPAAHDVRIAPVGSLAGLPATVVVTADGDPLHDGGCALVAELCRAGVSVSHLDYEAARHGFFGAAGDDVGQRALDEVVGALRESAGAPTSGPA